jgi:anaerobic glycerol-3-phosphate dehydrogenase
MTEPLSVRMVSPHIYTNRSIQMDADLPSLDQLRSNAAECIRLAEAARTSEHKSLFIEMAERWLTLAEHAAREGRLNGGSLFRDR